MTTDPCTVAATYQAAAHYADQARCFRVSIGENVPLARNTYRLRFECPELAAAMVPGQFLMLRLVDGDDPLLGRPFAFYDTVLDGQGTPLGLDVVYLAVGKMTGQLALCRPGEPLEVWGPLGNGFSPQPVDHLILVAGGIGQTPFLTLGKEFLGQQQFGSPPRCVPSAQRVTLCYGVRSADFLAGADDFRAAGIDLRISSDDGSVGQCGLVTELLAELLQEDQPATRRIACCGPEKMMAAVAHLAAEHKVPCEVSLEIPMACGMGICFSCVVPVLQSDGEWDYKRTCVEGPVFDAQQIVWQAG